MVTVDRQLPLLGILSTLLFKMEYLDAIFTGNQRKRSAKYS